MEQDARIARQALAFDAPEAMDARVRRMERLLDSMLDPHRLYGSVLQPHLTRWNGRTAWLALDTSSLRDRAWFVRLGLCYRQRAIPIAWRAYPDAPTLIGFPIVLPSAHRDRLPPQVPR